MYTPHNHHHQDSEHVHHPRIPSCPFAVNTPIPITNTPSLSPDPHWSVFCHYRLNSSILQFYINGLIQYFLFRVQLLSYNIMLRDSSRLLPVSVVCFFSLLNSIPWYGCPFIRSLTEGHLDCLQFLVIIHGAAINICASVNGFSCEPKFSFLQHTQEWGRWAIL